ncbi:rhodanese-like domain-containing protein [Oceanospirillum sanctuarii]|uniref:rhodanese-like domain-containing protein n=1 Tax=Oceanospirillum sanctuarii TaxID=1434821 RepID=UPI000A388C61|nr:rhodanese-like domain-containing protein [Oceanospirillum sanctuarii]
MTISRTGVPNGTALPARWYETIRYRLTALLQPADNLTALSFEIPKKVLAVSMILFSAISLSACSVIETSLALQNSSVAEEQIQAQLNPDQYLQPLSEEDQQLLSDPSLFDANGLRNSRYRAPVPSQAPGAMTLSDSEFVTLNEQNRLLLIDVLPTTLREGRFINTKQHKTIPGSFWLANTGKADAPESINRYFSDQLSILMARHPDKTPVFFCKTDCWMSWNAAAKASALGIKPLYWYPSGIDGWQEKGGDLVLQPPVPLSGSYTQQGVSTTQ